MKRFPPCAPHLAVLAELDPAKHVRNPSAAARRGQELAAAGVPVQCVGAAIALYIEACLPHLLSNPKWIDEFVRFAVAYQYYLLSGYERRSQDFSAKLGEAYEAERRRLAQDLHDEIGHDLIVLKLYTEILAVDLKNRDIAQIRRKLREAVKIIHHALTGVRRVTFDLGPAVWNEQGFLAAVRAYVRQFRRRTGIAARVNARRLHVDLPPRYQSAVYKVLQGALANVAAHSGAKSVVVGLSNGGGAVSLKIEDDGKGFDIPATMKQAQKSFGLRAMQDRIELLGGVDHVPVAAGQGGSWNDNRGGSDAGGEREGVAAVWVTPMTRPSFHLGSGIALSPTG